MAKIIGLLFFMSIVSSSFAFPPNNTDIYRNFPKARVIVQLDRIAKMPRVIKVTKEIEKKHGVSCGEFKIKSLGIIFFSERQSVYRLCPKFAGAKFGLKIKVIHWKTFGHLSKGKLRVRRYRIW